jgi:hypothetical protein
LIQKSLEIISRDFLVVIKYSGLLYKIRNNAPKEAEKNWG